MWTMTNFGSGEIAIADSEGKTICRLSREDSHRLIMTARMHAVEPFLQKLPTLIPNRDLGLAILALFDEKNASARWALKEKFARLTTLSRGYESKDPQKILEQTVL